MDLHEAKNLSFELQNLANLTNKAKRRTKEYERLQRFLTEHALIKYEITPEVIGWYLMTRTTKETGSFIALDTFKGIKSRVGEILNSLGYWFMGETSGNF